MITIAKSSAAEREVLFGNAADRAGISNPAIVEKDFWVCFVLDYLFHKSLWTQSFIFKGGTSLSKAYHVISRFSEDIDLIMDWRLLGYAVEEPWKDRRVPVRFSVRKRARRRRWWKNWTGFWQTMPKRFSSRFAPGQIPRCREPERREAWVSHFWLLHTLH